MKKFTFVFVFFMSLSISAYASTTLYSSIGLFLAMKNYHVIQVKNILNALDTQSDRYKISKNKNEKDFILSQIIQITETNSKKVPSILRPFIDQELQKVFRMRTYLRKGMQRSHNVLYVQIDNKLKNLKSFLKYL